MSSWWERNEDAIYCGLVGVLALGLGALCSSSFNQLEAPMPAFEPEEPAFKPIRKPRKPRKSMEQSGYDDWQAGHPSGWRIDNNENYRRGVERAVDEFLNS